jgi:glycosyltransferase involved in cell wall biosynthesis
MIQDRRTSVAQVVTRCIAGAGGVALRGALSLNPQQYRVTIVTGEGGPLTERAEQAGIDVVIEPALVAPIAPTRDARALGLLTERFARDGYDVVHTHSAKAGAIGRFAAHRAGVPAIVHTYHGFPFHEFQAPVRRAAYVAVERRLAAITDCVLAIGTGVATEALRRGLARPTALRTVTPVVDGVGPLKTPGSTALARAALGIQVDVPVVGTVGRVDFQKAPEHLLDALVRCRDDRTVLVWVGSGPLMEEMERRAGELGLARRVRFLGERSDVPELLPAFDVFAMSSRYEGLPCAIVEAMRCGLPVVATAVNSMSDLVIPGVTGTLVPPARPELLASALDQVFADPDRARRLAENGRALAGSAFDTAALGEVLDDVYTECLARSRMRLAS